MCVLGGPRGCTNDSSTSLSIFHLGLYKHREKMFAFSLSLPSALCCLPQFQLLFPHEGEGKGYDEQVITELQSDPHPAASRSAALLQDSVCVH